MIGTPVILCPNVTVAQTDFGISALSVLRDQRRQIREVALLREPGMSAASSWMMSGAVLPTGTS